MELAHSCQTICVVQSFPHDAVALAKWLSKEEKGLLSSTFATLKAELTGDGLKAPRKKDDAIKSVLRSRFRKSAFQCICCKDLTFGIFQSSEIPGRQKFKDGHLGK